MDAFELQRKNMVESQIRPAEMTDRRIMRAMLTLPREAFAAGDTRAVAYMDQDLPVGQAKHGLRRALLAPRVLARLVQALEIDPGDRALEIGTATGYGASVLAALAGQVVALECDSALAAAAARGLAALGIGNASVVTGPHEAGWPAEAPYAAILLAGAVPELPQNLLDQLRDGGRMAAVVHSGGVGRMTIWRRFGTTYATQIVGDGSARPLPGFEKKPGFVF